MGEERALLRDVAHAPALRGDVAPGAGDDLVVEGDRPAVEAHEPGDEAQQRGLAAAGGPEHRGQAAAGHVEVDAVEHERRAEALADLADADGRHGVLVRWASRVSNRVAGAEMRIISAAYGAAAP